jgi:hypothetical protein
VNDDPERSHLTPWLAAVYLGTHIPDFYKRFGAELHEDLAEDFCVMRIATSAVA